jgi:hypothetical protein
MEFVAAGRELDLLDRPKVPDEGSTSTTPMPSRLPLPSGASSAT